MLILAHHMGQLSFSALMEVYRGSNLKKAGFDEDVGVLREEQRLYDYLSQVFFRTYGARYAIWLENGRYTAAARLEPYRNGLLLAGLETAPDLRRKGYGERLLLAILESLPDGTRLYSHVDKHNTPSLNLHRKVGFQRVSESAVYIDGSADCRCCTFSFVKNAASP